MQFLKFNPIYKERIWGGRSFENYFNRKLPLDALIGESWEIVDRQQDQSIVCEGPLKNCSLSELLAKYPEAIMGPFWKSQKKERFPLLVKWLDCQKTLSLQVHPPQQVTAKIGGEPKSENWYIVDAKQEAKLFVGLKEGTTRQSFEQSINNNEVHYHLHTINARPGHSVFIPSGRIHAIGGGNLILEIQENSDTTYRVYDWGRKGLDGNARKLHIKESLESINFDDQKPIILGASTQHSCTLTHCPLFRINQCFLRSKEAYYFDEKSGPHLLSIVQGKGRIIEHTTNITGSLSPGDNIILPYAGRFNLEATSNLLILVTDKFT